MNKDMDIIDFARAISMRSIDTPVSNDFDANYGQKDKRWWSSQREHLTVWCIHQPTNDIPGFPHEPNTSSRAMYEHLGRPEMLLWLAETLGEEKDKLKKIVEEIKDKNLKTAKACGYIRGKISFDRILELLDCI